MSVKTEALSFLSWSGYALVIFVVVFGGALLGMLAARLLPEGHLSSETRTVVSASTNRRLTNAPLVVRSVDDALLAAIELHDRCRRDGRRGLHRGLIGFKRIPWRRRGGAFRAERA